MGHIFIKFTDLLRLGCQEIVVLQKLRDLKQEIAVYQINLIIVLLGFPAQILRIFLQNL